jgi:hypothetical protein
MPPPGARPPSVFVSYSHRDRDWLDRLRVHLKPLERNGSIGVWDDTRLAAGQAWHDEIRQALAAAAVAVLLVSADFLASDFIADEELPPLLAAAERRGVPILPLYLSPCRIAAVPALARLQSVNPLDRPLIALSRPEQEAVFVRLAEAVEAALSSPAAKLREKIRRRFEEIERTHHARLGKLENAFERKALEGMTLGIELSDKSQFLLEELVALPHSADPSLRGLLEREIAELSAQKKQLREKNKAEHEADLARIRDLFSRGTPT